MKINIVFLCTDDIKLYYLTKYALSSLYQFLLLLMHYHILVFFFFLMGDDRKLTALTFKLCKVTFSIIFFSSGHLFSKHGHCLYIFSIFTLLFVCFCNLYIRDFPRGKCQNLIPLAVLRSVII